MGFLNGLLNIILSAILSIDTLSFIYAIRKQDKFEKDDFIRLCYSWVSFLTIKGMFECDGEGFFAFIFCLIGVVLKIIVVIPKLAKIAYRKVILENKGAELLQKGQRIFQQLLSKVLGGKKSSREEIPTR